ncbi:MAG: universal stress protein [Euryarchaeota archaeon]|nr:universal stress protein [Euryarchaeota archaeon]
MPRVDRDESAEVGAAIEGLTRMRDQAPAGRKAAPLALRKILLAIDEFEGSQKAIAWTPALAGAFGSKVLVAHVLPSAVPSAPIDFGYGLGESASLLQELSKRGQGTVDNALGVLSRHGVTGTPLFSSGHPVAEIVRLAKNERVDLVVVGSHGRGAVGRLLLGSVADGVKNHVRASVLIAKGYPPPERILVATDGSRASKRAAALGMRLRRAFDASMTVLHVADMLLYGPPETGRKAFEAAFEGLDPVWNERKMTFDIESGHAAERIIERARLEESDLVILGSRGLSPLKTLVAGSVSDRVSHESNTSILIVKEASR